jgi:hypothetical protein
MCDRIMFLNCEEISFSYWRWKLLNENVENVKKNFENVGKIFVEKICYKKNSK